MSTDDASKEANKVDSVHWKNDPDDHDYPAAANYLALLATPDEANALADRLKTAPIVTFKAKDILRAARLKRLTGDDPHVQIDLNKAANGIDWSPVLLVRGDIRQELPTTIADGYHRVCASYLLNENTDIPARIIDLNT